MEDEQELIRQAKEMTSLQICRVVQSLAEELKDRIVKKVECGDGRAERCKNYPRCCLKCRRGPSSDMTADFYDER